MDQAGFDMGQPHKHRDVIVAWANGAQIQFFDVDEWIDCHEDGPRWHEEKRYRVKPKTVKREGWVNVYKDSSSRYWTSDVHSTDKKAIEANAGVISKHVACIRIEWVEETHE